MNTKMKTTLNAGSAALAALLGITALPMAADAWQTAITTPVVADTPQGGSFNRAFAGGHGGRGLSGVARVGGHATHGYGGRSFDLH